MAFDEFSNPAVDILKLVPINVRISQMDRTNNKAYTSNFPSIFVSDSYNRGIPTQLGGTFSRANSNRGTSTYHYLTVNWPYTSSSSDVSQKLVMKIHGGITCCNSYSNFYLYDTSVGNYVVLWTDTVANITVYETPTHSAVSTAIRIQGVKNPYPYQKETYE